MLIDLQLSKWVGFSFVLKQKVTLNDTTISKVLLFFASIYTFLFILVLFTIYLDIYLYSFNLYLRYVLNILKFL